MRILDLTAPENKRTKDSAPSLNTAAASVTTDLLETNGTQFDSIVVAEKQVAGMIFHGPRLLNRPQNPKTPQKWKIRFKIFVKFKFNKKVNQKCQSVASNG